MTFAPSVMIVVLSYKRSHVIFDDDNSNVASTVLQLQDAGVGHYLYCQKQEAPDYWKPSVNTSMTKVMPLDPALDDAGIAATRKEIVRIFNESALYDVLIMLDDDIEFRADTAASINWLAESAKTFNGISFLTNYGIYHDHAGFNGNLVIPTGRAMQAVAFNRKTASLIEYEPGTLSEDFNVAIQSHMMGWCNFGSLAFQIDSFVGNEGGVQAETKADEDKWDTSNKMMAELFPDYITYYTEWGFEKRHKLFVDWYAALLSQQTKLEVSKALSAANYLCALSMVEASATQGVDMGNERTLEQFNLRTLSNDA